QLGDLLELISECRGRKRGVQYRINNTERLGDVHRLLSNVAGRRDKWGTPVNRAEVVHRTQPCLLIRRRTKTAECQQCIQCCRRRSNGQGTCQLPSRESSSCECGDQWESGRIDPKRICHSPAPSCRRWTGRNRRLPLSD